MHNIGCNGRHITWSLTKLQECQKITSKFKMAVKNVAYFKAGVQFQGDLGEILAQGAKISPYIGLREKWESP